MGCTSHSLGEKGCFIPPHATYKNLTNAVCMNCTLCIDYTLHKRYQLHKRYILNNSYILHKHYIMHKHCTLHNCYALKLINDI